MGHVATGMGRMATRCELRAGCGRRVRVTREMRRSEASHVRDASCCARSTDREVRGTREERLRDLNSVRWAAVGRKARVLTIYKV